MKKNPCRAAAVALLLVAGTVSVSPAAARPASPPASPSEPRVPAAVERFLREQSLTNVEDLMFAYLPRPRHKGYRWAITAFKENPSAPTKLTIVFSRQAAEGTQTQTSTFGWTLPKDALRMDEDLKPSSLTTGKSMGSNGRISMKLGGPSQFARAVNPEGCTGSIAYRVGSFRGTFDFNARDQHFKRIRFPRSRVLLYRARNLRCEPRVPRPGCPDDLSLSAVDPEAGVAVGAFRTEEGKVNQNVVVVGTSGEARTAHRISVTVSTPAAFEASDDLTSASVDGDVAGPWLSGDLAYLAPLPGAPGEDPSCGSFEASSGVVTGDYTAHFDSIGAVTPASTAIPATLRREAP